MTLKNRQCECACVCAHDRRGVRVSCSWMRGVERGRQRGRIGKSRWQSKSMPGAQRWKNERRRREARAVGGDRDEQEEWEGPGVMLMASVSVLTSCCLKLLSFDDSEDVSCHACLSVYSSPNKVNSTRCVGQTRTHTLQTATWRVWRKHNSYRNQDFREETKNADIK